MSKIIVEGKGGIYAKVLADSVSSVGVRLMTFEVEFPRYILSEYNTHRMFSRNAASTRAIPILKMLEQIAESPAMPIYYGKNQTGMSAKEELSIEDAEKCKTIIDEMRLYCTEKVKELHSIGLHKQHAGRYIEPWQMVKGVVSSTEWDNFFWLRNDEAAQPEIKELARCMQEAKNQSIPEKLYPGEWHLPYIEIDKGWCGNSRTYMIKEDADGDYKQLTLEEAIIVSCARCAAVSFRSTNYNLEKSTNIYQRLVGDEKKHSSALEHCATPVSGNASLDTNGVTAFHNILGFMSGNLSGWIQYRQLIEGHTYYGNFSRN